MYKRFATLQIVLMRLQLACTTVPSCTKIINLASTDMSVRDVSFREGSFLKIPLSCCWFYLMFHFPVTIFFCASYLVPVSI